MVKQVTYQLFLAFNYIFFTLHYIVSPRGHSNNYKFQKFYKKSVNFVFAIHFISPLTDVDIYIKDGED